jgi:hypothetical protein
VCSIEFGVDDTARHGDLTCILFCRQQHGCNFWNWELAYVEYLVDREIIRGEDAVEAIGWVQERREQLLLKKAEKQAIGQEDLAIARHNEEQVVDHMLVKNMQSLLHAVKKMELLLMISVAMLALLCVLLFVMISKK